MVGPVGEGPLGGPQRRDREAKGVLVVRLEGLLGGVDRRQRQSEVAEPDDHPGKHGERVGEQERPTGGELVTDELQQRLALEAVVEADVAGGVGR